MKAVIAFRVDASVEIGTGHVMRCLTLAEGLRNRGVECHFICRSHEGNLAWLIRDKGYHIHLLPVENEPDKGCLEDEGSVRHAAWLGASQAQDARACCEILDAVRTDWVIVDHYALGRIWETMVAQRSRIAVIDDLADRHHACRVLVDQNWCNAARYQGLVNGDARQLLGPRYALLGPDYKLKRQTLKKRSGGVRQILVFMGGSDPANRTRQILEALITQALADVALKVVVGVSSPHYESLVVQFGRTPNLDIYRGMPTLAGLMAESDLMVGAGGSTGWERMCLGLPSVVLSIAENQTALCQALAQAGYITYLGDAEAVSTLCIREAVLDLIRKPELLAAQSAMMLEMVDGSGVERVCDVLLTEKDGKCL